MEHMICKTIHEYNSNLYVALDDILEVGDVQTIGADVCYFQVRLKCTAEEYTISEITKSKTDELRNKIINELNEYYKLII